MRDVHRSLYPVQSCEGRDWENNTFVEGEAYLKQKGIELVVLQNKECEGLMQKFISEQPEIW